MYLVARTCTEIYESGSGDQVLTSSQPLGAYEDVPAYVLLGDPGAGKTTIFQEEADRTGALCVTARDLVTFRNRPEWHKKTLFIDGLDEIRAGSLDARTPFDAIRTCLDKLGCPPFRLSCREADWFGVTDTEHLRSVSPDGQITVLHLDPLTRADVVTILSHDSRIPDAEEFIRGAEQRGIDDLLSNPQVLDMLVNAVHGAEWPDTRWQTFELACQTVIREHNREHIAATRTQPIGDIDQQLHAAGFLFAVQLISGNAGYALTRDAAHTAFPELDSLGYENGQLLQSVTKTKLFKGPLEGRRTPVHRHVAEFLAARYLAERVDSAGLPIGRVLALITGEDGVVVTELRGLSAWLAALSANQRSTVIDRDPLGVVLYGDVRNFTRQDKRRVLDGLRREAERYTWFRSAHWTTSPFGALATADMEPEFCSILTASDRSDTHQALADCVLDALTHGARLPGLDDIVLDVIRDPTWWPRIRRSALEVFHHKTKGKDDAVLRLRTLLADISNDSVPDPADDLLGYLLTVLYPGTISPTEILNYLHAPKQRNYFGRYLMFWHGKVLDQSSDTDIGVLLDAFTARCEALGPVLDDDQFRELTSGALARGLEAHDEAVESRRLYDWLGLGLDKHGWPQVTAEEEHEKVRRWLKAHPDAQKSVLELGLVRCAESERFDLCMHKVQTRLFHAERPADFGRWCLERARTATDDRVARYLFQEAVATLWREQGNTGLSLDTFERCAEHSANFKAWLADMLVCRVEPEERRHLRELRLLQARKREEKQQWLHFVKSREAEVREGRVFPRLLYDLAGIYFGYVADSKGDSPLERLRIFLDQDEALVQAVIAGLHRSLERDDVPKVPDIFRLYTEGKTFLLARPFLAALDDLTRVSANGVLKLSDDQIRQALAFYLVNPSGNEPDWYRSLLVSRPDLVAGVLMDYVTVALRGRSQHVTGLYALAYNDEYAEVARRAVLPLLTAFSVRSANEHLDTLDYLLKAALRHLHPYQLRPVIKEKLRARSINVAQRARWLASGLVVAPDDYLEPLLAFAENRARQVRCLTGFLAHRDDQWSPIDDLPVSALGALVQLIGNFYTPYSPEETGWETPEVEAADFVSRLIARLGSLPGQDAADTLHALSADRELQSWHLALRRAQYEQHAVQREASFRHPDIRQVSETLNNQSPANAADLAALVTEVLRDMAYRIRHGNTDDYRQFWNEDSRRHLTEAKHEDACRDALLSDLKQRLAPLRIDAVPEGHYADDNRADIRVAFNGVDGFNVPVEIKKNTHEDLWRAIHDQLIAKYTRDPGAHGFGVYLVFWFGAEGTPLPPSGSRPRNADELEQRLQAALSVDESREISISVIDVSKPG